jgi:hypothetical protein
MGHDAQSLANRMRTIYAHKGNVVDVLAYNKTLQPTIFFDGGWAQALDVNGNKNQIRR